jgi:hypothetical protein
MAFNIQITNTFRQRVSISALCSNFRDCSNKNVQLCRTVVLCYPLFSLHTKHVSIDWIFYRFKLFYTFDWFILTGPAWRVMDRSPHVYKEGLCASSAHINRLMMMIGLKEILNNNINTKKIVFK